MTWKHVRRIATLMCVAALVSAITGCAAQVPSVGGNDGRVIAALEEIAPRDAKVDEPITQVSCWKPSEHMIDDDTFRVLCRLDYEQAGADRYRDMICIGSVTQDPVTEYCYLWAFYSDMPTYEDFPGYRAA